ncbi:MAG: ATP-dependent Clp protease adaptor ClpS [Myxococcales bacterium]|nr:ATP-dependent Clp protease adaptor ClpS [Myxococcales bacterium]
MVPPNDPKPPNPERDDDLVVEEERKIQRPKRWKVLFHNDDYTTKEFVIEVLVRFFEKSESEATYVMLSVHHKGMGVAGLYPKDIAESKVDKTMTYAREHGMPLKVTAEQE